MGSVINFVGFFLVFFFNQCCGSLETAAKYESIDGVSYCFSPYDSIYCDSVSTGASKRKGKKLILAISGASVDACILAVFTVNQGLHSCACAFVCSHKYIYSFNNQLCPF